MRYLLAVLNLAVCTVTGAAAIFVGGMACDESCYGQAGDWSDDRYSWQWNAIQGLGLALFAFAPLLLVFASTKRVGPSVTFFGGQVAVWLLFLSLTSSADDLSIGLPLVFATAQLALGGATVLATRRARANAEFLT